MKKGKNKMISGNEETLKKAFRFPEQDGRPAQIIEAESLEEANRLYQANNTPKE